VINPTVGRYVLVATAATLPLHLRHVIFGLRSERPAAYGWTLAGLAAANVAAAIFIGRVWTLQLASLAVSMLIVLRAPVALALASLVALAPLLLTRTSLGPWQKIVIDSTEIFPAAYLALSIAWRTVTLYVPVRLVAMIREIEAARHSLQSSAIIHTRTRIQGELHNGLELALQRIIMEGEGTSRLVTRDPVEASAALRTLVGDSRRALAEARRIAAGYRTGSLQAELDAAVALLQAAGSTCRINVATDVSLDMAATRSSDAIRATVVRALLGHERVDCVMRVELDETGGVRVVVTPDVRDRAEARL